MTSACAVTSRAVVGSSASRTSGWQASAIAIVTRWRMPPENSCGYRRTRSLGMPTSSNSSRARVLGGLFGQPGPHAQHLDNLEPIRRTGLNAFIAPWNTMAISVQRALCTVSCPRP